MTKPPLLLFLLCFSAAAAGQNVGIGNTTPVSLLSNTSTNIIGSDFNGITQPSLTWAMTSNGYTGAFYNGSTMGNANGMAVKIAGTASTNHLLDLSTGTSQASAGNAVMVVNGAGEVGIGTAYPVNTLSLNGNTGIWNNNLINFYTDNGSSQKGFVGMYSSGGSDFSLASTGMGNWLRLGANNSNIAFFPDNTLTTGSNPKVVITAAGFVGIATTTPGYPLDIENSMNSSYSGYGFLNQSGGTGYGSGSSGTVTVSIHSIGRILSAEVDVQSDRRIKRNFENPNTASLLNKVNALQVTKYNYIDTIQKGSRSKTGFIAQQVEEVFPTAVNKNMEIIPSVFEAAENVFVRDSIIIISTRKEHGFSVGDEVLLYNRENHAYHVLVAEVINANTFSAQHWCGTADKLFVFGKKVNDFRTIDFDQITALAVGAIQELTERTKTLETENNLLKDKNDDLLKALLKLQASGLEQTDLISTMKAQIEAINERLNITSKR